MQKQEEIIPTQKESITLKKMSKGYQWDIKIFIEEKADTETLHRLAVLNENLEKMYGTKETD